MVTCTICSFCLFVCFNLLSYIYTYIASQMVFMDWILLPICGELWESFLLNLIYPPSWISVVASSNKEIYFLFALGSLSEIMLFHVIFQLLPLATSNLSIISVISLVTIIIQFPVNVWDHRWQLLFLIYIYSCQATGNCLDHSLDETLFHLNVFLSFLSILKSVFL